MTDLIALVGSARKGGNTDVLTSAAISGAREAGATARKIRLSEIHMEHCRGCMRCVDGRCRSHDDDIAGILPAMLEAKGLLFATPVYFWNVSGLMKNLVDRMLPLAGLDLKSHPVTMEPLLRGVRAGSIVIQEEAQGPHRSIVKLFFDRNFADFGMTGVGDVYAFGALKRGEVRGDREAMDSARQLGRRLVGR